MEWMLLPLRRYTQFSGRSRRKEFWMFFVLTLIIYAVAMTLDNLFGFGSSARYADVSGGSASVGFSANGGIITLLAMLALLLRSEEHTSELQSLMRISYAVFCLKK